MPYNILFISSWFPNNQQPQSGDFVWRHAKAVALQHHVEVLHVVGAVNQQEQYVVDDYTQNGVRIVRVYYRQSPYSALNFLRRRKAYRRFFSMMKKPDIVHANVLRNPMLFAVYLKRKYHIPFVVTEHWTAFQPEKIKHLSQLNLAIAKHIARHAAKVLPVSEDLKNCLQQAKIGKRYHVVGNVVDTEVFKISEDKKETTTFNLLHISSLNNRKQPLKILRAAVQLYEKGLPIKLSIGGNDDLAVIRSFIKKHNAEEYISTFGMISHEEVAEKMATADLFVLFSTEENLPCVLLEAMACGVGFVSSDVGGIREIATEEKGVLVPLDDWEQLVASCEKIVQGDTILQSKKALRSYVVENFSMPVIANKFSEIYTQILRGK